MISAFYRLDLRHPFSSWQGYVADIYSWKSKGADWHKGRIHEKPTVLPVWQGDWPSL